MAKTTSSLSGSVPYSFEIYPPRTCASEAALQTTILHLAAVKPEFISVTYGAGGSSHASSLDILRFILSHTNVDALAHLTCVGSTHAQMSERIREFLAAGITSFLALRGDPPQGAKEADPFLGDLSSAAELVRLIAQVSGESNTQMFGEPPISGGKPHIRIAVAAFPNGHPNSRSRAQDIETLCEKQAAGADFAITQLFFRSDDYLSFVNDAREGGVHIPILPGVMPVISPQRLHRVQELTGEKIPSDLLRQLENEPTHEGRMRSGVDYAVGVVNAVIAGGAPGIHLYAFNQHETVLSVLVESGLISPNQIDFGTPPTPSYSNQHT